MATEIEQIILKYIADTKQANANLEELGKENEQVAGDVAEVNEQLAETPKATSLASQGVAKLQGAFKVLLANPIVLVIAGIVAGVTALYNAFTRTASGGDTVAKVFEGLQAVMGPVLDSLGKLTQGIALFLSGDFEEGVDAMANSFNGLAGEMELAYDQAGQLVDLRRTLLEMNRELTVSESEIKLQMDQQRAILDDASLGINERIQANEKLNELNKELLASRQAVIDKQLEEAELQKSQAGLDDAELQTALDRIAELTARKNDAEAERFRIEKEFVTKRNDLLNQQLTQDQQREMIRMEQANERFRMDEERQAEQFAITSERIKGQKIQEVQLATNSAMQVVGIETEATERIGKTLLERQQDAQDEFDLKVNLANASVGLLNALGGVFGKQAKLQKAFSISSAIISTLTAGAQVLADPSAITPIQKAISLATILATGFATVQKIASTPTPGGGGGSSFTRPNLAGSVSSTNNGFATLGQESPTDVNVVNQADQPPIRAIVMEGDITSMQEATAEANAKSDI